MVGLLRATAQHHVLQAVLDEEVAQSDAVAAAGAGRAHREVDAAQVEDGAEVHVDRRVHGLEHVAIAQHGRVVLLVHHLCGLDHRLCRRVVAEEASHLVGLPVVVVDAGLGEGVAAGHIGIAGLFRHAGARVAVEHLLGDFRLRHDARQSGAVAVVEPLLLQADARLAVVEGVPDGVQVCPETRPDAHSGDCYSS